MNACRRVTLLCLQHLDLVESCTLPGLRPIRIKSRLGMRIDLGLSPWISETIA